MHCKSVIVVQARHNFHSLERVLNEVPSPCDRIYCVEPGQKIYILVSVIFAKAVGDISYFLIYNAAICV